MCSSDLRAALTHPPHDGREIYVDTRHTNAQSFRAPKLANRARRAQNSLRGHAASVQAVAPEPCALDERDTRAQIGRAYCADEASCPATNHDEVVASLRLWVLPLRRAHETLQGVIGVVFRQPHAVLLPAMMAQAEP